ncbi:hypothetical protein CHY08_02150 [Rhizobium leguminosarum bv. viciae]|nr:hypothetical protein CHY08_02150 [Rhizobium leguminosarum bv. viciae]
MECRPLPSRKARGDATLESQPCRRGEEAIRIKPADGLVSTLDSNNSHGTQTLIWIKSRSRRN